MEEKNVPIKTAAAMMGVSPQFLRFGLKQDKFPFGVGVKQKGWRFYINPVKFKEYLEKGC